MKRFVSYVGVLLLAGLVVSCGGGGGGGGGGSPASPAANNGSNPPADNPPPVASKPGRFEETDAKVSLSPGDWVEADARFGWSGGGAMQSTVAGATATFQFSGTSVTWIGARSDDGGTAEVSVDGGPVRQISLVSRPNEKHTPVVTLHDLGAGQHTLTIRVTSAAPVVVDAFDVEAPIVSHKQENDPDVAYTGTNHFTVASTTARSQSADMNA